MEKDKLEMKLREEVLKKNPHALRKAIALFPMSVFKTAAQLSRLLQLKEIPSDDEDIDTDLDKLIEQCENSIRDRFKELFGKEMF